MKINERILERFTKEASVIVATNALGLGVDIPDVELVIHAGSPRRLIDFAQESGRCGRDGRSSKSVVLFLHTNALEGNMISFLEAKACRRILLDSVMDGIKRSCCSDDEILCDICGITKQPTVRYGEEPFNVCYERDPESFTFDDDNGAFDDNGISDETLNEVCDNATRPTIRDNVAIPVDKTTVVSVRNPYVENRARTLSQNVTIQRKRKLAEDSVMAQCTNDVTSRRRYIDKQQEESTVLRRCQEMLNEFVKSECVFCVLLENTRSHCNHEHDVKLIRRRRTAAIDRFMRSDKFPNYSGCFEHGCYAPQAWCNGWEENRARRLRGEKKIPCMYRYVCLDVIYAILLLEPSLSEYVNRLVIETEAKDAVHLFSLAKTWNGLKTNYLYYTFYCLLKEYREKNKQL